MSTAGASDSSMDSSVMDSLCSCPSCSSRMISLLYDQHKLCVTCCGQEYEFHNKCVECLSWPDDIFEKYVKHRRSLLAKSKADAIPLSGSISEEKVRSLIGESLAQFSSMKNSWLGFITFLHLDSARVMSDRMFLMFLFQIHPMY